MKNRSMSQHDEHRGHSTASVWGDHWTSGWVCLRCLVIMLITISSQMAKCKPRCKETDSFVRRKKHVLIPFDGKRENDWFLNFFISGRPNTCNPPPPPHVRVCPVFANPLPGGSAGRPWWKPPYCVMRNLDVMALWRSITLFSKTLCVIGTF